MITILPTTVSGLQAATYRVDLPGEINPTRPRAQKITTTIDGGAAVTLWPRNNAGASQSVQLTMSEEKYRKLRQIVDHPTVFEWLVMCEGRRYVCAVDVETPVSVTIGSQHYKQLGVAFVVIEDKNT